MTNFLQTGSLKLNVSVSGAPEDADLSGLSLTVSDCLPDPAGVVEDAGSVRPAASFALSVADVPGQELDYVLARVAERLAYLVEDAGSLCLPGIAVGAALFCDILRL